MTDPDIDPNYLLYQSAMKYSNPPQKVDLPGDEERRNVEPPVHAKYPAPRVPGQTKCHFCENAGYKRNRLNSWVAYCDGCFDIFDRNGVLGMMRAFPNGDFSYMWMDD